MIPNTAQNKEMNKKDVHKQSVHKQDLKDPEDLLNLENIIIDGTIYSLKRTDDESKEIFNERVTFIIKNQINKNNESIDDLVILSKAWANIKFLKCQYDHVVTGRIADLNYK